MSSTDDSLPAEDALKIRLQHRVRRDFLLRMNKLQPEDAPFSRSEVREEVLDLNRYARSALIQEQQRRFQKLELLLEGDRQTFDEPKVEHEDLVDGVRVCGFYR